MTRLILSALFVATVVTVFASRSQAQVMLPDSLHVVWLGSSTAAGAGASPKDSAWVWRYSAYLKSIDSTYTVTNLAVGGYTTYHIQPSEYAAPDGRYAADTLRNITRAIDLHADAIIVNLPSNDAAKGYSIIEQTQNFERVAMKADSAGIPLWVCTTQPRHLTDTLRMNLITMKDWILDRFKDHALDFWSELAVEDGSMHSEYNSGDGVHLNNAGHAVLFSRVRDADIPFRLGGSTSVAPALASTMRLSAFPQPARDLLTVTVHIPSAAPATLLLTDLLGRTIQRVQLRPDSGPITTQLQLSHLPRGVYHLVLHGGQHVIATSIIVSR